VLRAVMPDERTRKLLVMKRDEPCLLMIRRNLDRRRRCLGGPVSTTPVPGMKCRGAFPPLTPGAFRAPQLGRFAPQGCHHARPVEAP